MRVDQYSPQIEKEEVFQVLATLEDNWLTEGKRTEALEAALADYCGCKRVIMAPNGTLALFAALKVLGIGPGDEIIVPDFTFFGSASAVGLAQFSRPEQTIRKKQWIRARYHQHLASCPGVRLPEDNGLGNVVPFRAGILIDDPQALADHLLQQQIMTRRFFYPLHLQPSFNEENSVVRRRPVRSVRLFEAGLMLPSGLDLTEDQIDFVCRQIELFAGRRADSASCDASPHLVR